MIFDETTKQKAEECGEAQANRFYFPEDNLDFERCRVASITAFTAGRESAKESLAIAVRALEKCSDLWHPSFPDKIAAEALSLIRERGDLP